MFLFTSISCSLLLGEIPCNQPSEVPPGFFSPFLPMPLSSLSKGREGFASSPTACYRADMGPPPRELQPGMGAAPLALYVAAMLLVPQWGDDMRMDGAALPTFLCPLLCLLWGCVPPALIGCGQGVFPTPSWGLQLHLSHVLGGGGRQCQAGREREREKEREVYFVYD